MKKSTITSLLVKRFKVSWVATVLVFAITVSPLFAQNKPSQFESVRQEMRSYLEPVQKDGSHKISKQFRRWEWHWESRLMPDGSFPSAQHYLAEVKRVENRKREADVQASPTWKELGPTAPDMPGDIPGWNGIGRVNVVESFASDPNLLLLGSAQGGIWKSVNGGSVWAPVDVAGYPIFSVSAIVAAPSNENIVYVATGDVDATVPSEVSGFPSFSYGILKSTDKGVTWNSTALSMLPEANNLISALWVSPTNPNVVVAATFIGIMKSTDGGASWTQTSGALQYRDIVQHPTDEKILYSSSFFISGGCRIYKSTDAGDSWTEVMALPQVSRVKLAVTKAKPNLVMFVAANAAGGGLEGVYKSLDNGDTFTKLGTQQNLLGWASSGNDFNNGGQGWYDLAMEISPTNSSQVFVGGINVWRSSNEGATWVLSAHWTGQGAPWVHADIHYLKYQKSVNKLLACSDGGIARSTDNGVQWRDQSQGLKIQQYYGIATSNIFTGLTMAGAQDNGTALTRSGTAYSHVLDGDGMACAIDKVNPQIVYGSQYNGRFYRSLNQGNSFAQMSSEGQRGDKAAWVAPIACDPKNTSTVYIGYTSLYKSTNSGSSWVRLGALPNTATMRTIAIAPSNPNYIYVGYNGAVYYSTNGGSTFTQQNGIGGFVMNIEVHPTNPEKIWVAFGAFSASQKILEITKGVVQNITGVGLPNVPCNTIAFQPGPLNRLFVGTDVGVFFKDEASSTWTPYGVGMPSTVISDIDYLPSTSVLRVATYGRGIWEIDAVQCQATKPTIKVIGSSNICFGDSVVIEAQSGYASYSWSNGAQTNRVVIKDVSESGDYTVSVQDASGCHATSTTIKVVVSRAPVKPLISVKSDTLRSSAIGGITKFQWYKAGTPLVAIPGATSREYKATETGDYVVRIENDEGCFSYSDAATVTSINVSVNEDAPRANEIYTAPNPFSTELSVTVPMATSGIIELVNIRGEIVYTGNVSVGVTNLNIPTSNLASGTYVVRLRTENSVYTALTIKQ